MREYDLQCQKQLNYFDRQRIEVESRLHAEINGKVENTRSLYEQKLTDNQRLLDDARTAENDIKLQNQRTQQSNPYKDEMDEQERKLKVLGEKRLTLFQESSDKQKDIDRILSDVALQRKDLETACDKDVATIENDVKLVTDDILKLDDMLGRQKGSFIEWLGENVDGWEENLGKVLDEDTILYKT